MTNKNKNQGSGEFEDDFEDIEDFSDADFDASAYEDVDYDDLPGEEGDDFEGDDFEGDEWGDEEEGSTDKKGKKKKEKSGGGLSFNAMMIIGAVVVGGGVMALNIMNQTAAVKAEEKPIWRSMLNISGVMDGMLFGDAEEGPSAEEIAKQEAAQQEGFLNNPELAVPPPVETTQNTPPQPMPIAPDSGAVPGEQLTPMPTPSAEAPRGPDETPPVLVEATPPVVPDTPITPDAPVEATESAPSAEDILKKAIANREQKGQAEERAPETSAEASKPVIEAKPVELALEEKTEEPTPIVTSTPTVSPQEVEANKQAVSSLETKLDSLLKRMDQIESDLGAVKQGSGTSTQELEQTVAALRAEIDTLKKRPAQVEKVVEKIVEKKSAPIADAAEADEEPVAKPAPVRKKKVVSKPATATTSSTPKQATTSGAWELRAAQPGRAWVSKPGVRDMQGVTVGETLAGIGRVTAITYQNGRWAVVGTQGQILQ
ncbi:MAG: hypothetical protein DI551_00335 [Micavibrio aeruginosavorus]|uniref:Uncharacterized protein n=1 Tax=Micavibrio aeruginosavorus TaxID=349221 RepID=A0A2W5Q2Z0_9BACT|nr:MAG: hypothetical protein DI551_00335 [Micavibrio aeruginosavorus]